MWKMKIFVNMWKGHCYSLKTLVHLLEGNQAIYLRLLKRKTNFQENANSCSKSWVNPFKKLEIFSMIFKWHFCSLKCIFSTLAHNKTIYLYRGLQGVTGGYRGKRKIEMSSKKKIWFVRMQPFGYLLFVATLFWAIPMLIRRKSTPWRGICEKCGCLATSFRIAGGHQRVKIKN